MSNPKNFGDLIHEAILDGEKGSLGRLVALFFLTSAWLIGTAGGVVMVLNHRIAEGFGEWLLIMSLIALSHYGTTKGLGAIERTLTAKYTGGNAARITEADPGVEPAARDPQDRSG